jgi:acyl carrier protein
MHPCSEVQSALDEREIRAQLRAWIAKHAKQPLGRDFGDATAMLELGILSSLDIVEFVLFIESLRGEEVEPDRIQPEAFASVDSVYTAFFATS